MSAYYRAYRRRFYTMGVVILISFLWAGSTGWAQDGVITLDDTVIKGRIQKPEAFYILQNANLSYEMLEIKPSFINELLESIEEEPF